MGGWGDRIFDWTVNLILVLVGLVALMPLLYVVSASVTPYGEVLKNGGYVLIPRAITFDAYKQLFDHPRIFNSVYITLFITVVGTLVNMVLTVLVAYPLSRRNLPGRGLFMFLVLVTILFSGGIVPTYLVVKATGLLDTVWAMIIPSAIASFNVLVMKGFFESLPDEILESARLDGASEYRILLQMVLPLSKPALMVVTLFYAVGHWNEFLQAILYITDRDLQPMQVVVREILMATQNPLQDIDALVPTVTMQMATVVFASVPIIVVYPFLQKYFTKGLLLGSIKG
jgi:putative aldouronate transport system permease protein